MVAGQDKATLGFRMFGDDDRNVVQFRHDGFTFSRLRPYKDWKALWRAPRWGTTLYVRP